MRSGKGKIFMMADPKCSENGSQCSTPSYFRPEDVQEMLGIKRRTYYARLKFLGIETRKDKDGKSFLDESQLSLFEKLDEYIKKEGKMEGFEHNNNGASLVKAEAQQLETASEVKLEAQNAAPEGEEINEFDLAAQLRAAEVLSTAGEALTAKYVANPELLAPELRRKVFARSVGLPKLYDPAEMVKGIVTAAQGRYKGEE